MTPSKSKVWLVVGLLHLMRWFTGEAFQVVPSPSLMPSSRRYNSVVRIRPIPKKVLQASKDPSANNNDDASSAVDLAFLKQALTSYLAKRKEVNADAAAQQQVGKIIGGTKGNPVLEYVSGSPNKPIVIDEPPNIFDYDELERYGYGDLVTSIMKAGGRNAMYELFDMPKPPPPKRLQPKQVPKLVIDKTGETDQARYTGLKMGQVLDDNAMAEALARAQQKAKLGEPLRPKIAEEDYVQPFADKRNVSPKLTPDWTPEMLDEYGKSRGRALAWARRARMGEFVQDPFETLDLPLSFKAYAVITAYFVAFANGRATPNLLAQWDLPTDGLEILKLPALAILVASVGSAVVNAFVLAPSKNRGTLVWAVKGLLAGPIAVAQLRGLEALVTRNEERQDIQLSIRNQQQPKEQ